MDLKFFSSTGNSIPVLYHSSLSDSVKAISSLFIATPRPVVVTLTNGLGIKAIM